MRKAPDALPANGAGKHIFRSAIRGARIVAHSFCRLSPLMPTNATLQDVADRAGVHRSTVALALRDHPRISEPVRRRVQVLARELGYRINPLVAALMQSRRSNRTEKHVSLAYVTNYPTRYGWRPEHHDRPDFFPGAAARARALGYKLEDFWLAEPGMTPQRFCEILTSRGINGMIVGRLPPGQDSLELEWGRFSCVALGLTLKRPHLHHVTENHFNTVTQAMQQCRERGYRRVGLVYARANENPLVGDLRLGAYLQQQQSFPKRDRVPACPMVPADQTAFTAWFRRYEPDALLAVHAPPVLQWLGKLGVSVPRGVGLVDLADKPKLDCAGVYYDPAAIGALAVEVLVGLLHRNETGVPTNQHEVLLRGVWHEGRTLPSRR